MTFWCQENNRAFNVSLKTTGPKVVDQHVRWLMGKTEICNIIFLFCPGTVTPSAIHQNSADSVCILNLDRSNEASILNYQSHGLKHGDNFGIGI